jgi:hypothetical protein
MPRITGLKQQVRPAIASARPANSQARAATTQASKVTARNTSLSGVLPGRSGTVNSTLQATAPMTCCCSVCTGLECLDRTRFFSGQLLTESDLNNEQSYMLAKNRLHNRYLQGWGVVCGLQVTCSACDQWVTINPGYAIDPCGNDIIVCTAQSFNVIQAINACCKPQAQTANCSPLRYSPSPTCQDAQQQWCITVQYQEQPSNMVTPLQQSTSQPSSCCSGSSTGGCGCGCNGSNGNSMNSASCGSASTQTSNSATTPTGACEATRIIEGFQFSVSPLPEAGNDDAQPGTLVYQIKQCTDGIGALIQQAPNPNNLQGAQQWYSAMCSWVVSVQQYFSQSPSLTYCVALDRLNTFTVPAPGPNVDVSVYEGIEAAAIEFLIEAWLECVCLALLPQCPPAACDNRVPLACVTVQNGIVQSICHFECRKQLIGYTALNYWLGPLFSAIGTLVGDVLERLCCPSEQKGRAYYADMFSAYQSSNITTGGMTNGAVFNRAVGSFMMQKMGASMANTFNPNLNAVDTRPYVGQSMDTAGESLRKQGFNVENLDVQNVDADPSWNAAAVAAGTQLAPSAVSTSQPLTFYVKGKSIVGIEVTDPTRALQLQVQSLTTQLANMQTTLNNMQGQPVTYQQGTTQETTQTDTAPGAAQQGSTEDAPK